MLANKHTTIIPLLLSAVHIKHNGVHISYSQQKMLLSVDNEKFQVTLLYKSVWLFCRVFDARSENRRNIVFNRCVKVSGGNLTAWAFMNFTILFKYCHTGLTFIMRLRVKKPPALFCV